MAKRKVALTATQTVTTIDVIDLITTTLDSIEGISFARDAWENKAPDQYGVVEMAEEPRVMIADGKVIDETYLLNVTLYVNGAGDSWPETIRAKLENLEATYEWLDIGCRLVLHQYDYTIGKVRWTFRLTVPGPLVRTVTVESGS